MRICTPLRAFCLVHTLLSVFSICVWQVKNLCVRNLMLSMSEETLANVFDQVAGQCGVAWVYTLLSVFCEVCPLLHASCGVYTTLR